MPTFKEILTATPEKLVNFFYKIKPAPTSEFLVCIDWTATQLEVNHWQLVCSLGFNAHARDLTDIMALLGITSFKSLAIRRNELFATDAYEHLPIDNVLDIYTHAIHDAEFTKAIQETIPRRLELVEKSIGRSGNPALEISYRMEVHAIYNGALVGKEFADKRLSNAALGPCRLVAGEVDVIVDNNLLPAPNIFFMDSVMGEEKRGLVERALITKDMVKNRLTNTGISDEEQQVLSTLV
ncbi:MAG TPA: hypothetical protein VMH34_02385 [Gammaproteobacteria bacterium]|nr:hypothetical protein [Gammaproteobacteria bacterium]